MSSILVADPNKLVVRDVATINFLIMAMTPILVNRAIPVVDYPFTTVALVIIFILAKVDQQTLPPLQFAVPAGIGK